MPDPNWLTAMIPLVKDLKTWEILKEQVVLLTMQRDDAIGLLDKSDAALAEAKIQIARLQNQVDNLKKEVAGLQPVADVPREALQILQYLFNETRFYAAKDFARIFDLELGAAKYHCDKLKDLKLVAVRRRAIRDDNEAPEEIGGNPAGRAYLVDNNLVRKDPRGAENS